MRRRKNGRLKTAAWIAALAVTMTAGKMASYAAVYQYESDNWLDGVDDEEEEEETSSRTRRGSGETQSGPGTVMETDTVLFEGALVNQNALSEQYHEDYKIYEESIGDIFFFYSNVKNGGITHETVVLDIPQNLTYTVELNGVPWAYQSGTPIINYGTYVFKFSGIEDTSLPFSEQKEYRAVFRFRIQEKPPEEETTEAAEEVLSSQSSSEWSSFTYDGVPISEEETGRIQGRASQESEEENWEAWTENTESSEEESEEESTNESGETQKSQESQEESTEQAETEETLPEEEGEPEGSEEDSSTNTQSGYQSRTQVYNPTLGRYQVTFANGKILMSNVPEGYIGSGAVELILPEDKDTTISLYKNDEWVDYVQGNNLTEPGYYRVEVDGQPWFCTVASFVREVNHYPAPAGMHFTSAVYNGETMELSSERYVSMEKDGQYQFTLEGEEGDRLEVMLKKDTEPPQVEIQVKGGEAAIQYLSDDIEQIVLEKDGKIQEGFSGYSITSPGNYRLTVTDTAGNAFTSRFSLSYQINRYGVIAVVLVILLIAGGVGFVIYTKRTVKVR